MDNNLFGSRYIGCEENGSIGLLLPQYLLQVLEHDPLDTMNDLHRENTTISFPQAIDTYVVQNSM
jgi:hypothetical protein